MKRLALALALCLIAAPLARAEGDPEPDAKPKVVRKARPKPKPKPKAAPVATTPAAPIPYSTYTGPSPDMVKALTPGTSPSPAPEMAGPPMVAAPNAPLPSRPVDAPPPPPPVPDTTPVPQAVTEISLRCETQTFIDAKSGAKFETKGTFYVDLFPSPVFPDRNASFRFLFVEPAHDSLVRDSICQDTPCSAIVSGVAYSLVDQRTRHGSVLRLSLDRATGAFYGEEIGKDGRHGTAQKRSEKGVCTPQSLPQPLF